jgi:hypothetical protein
MEMAEEDTHAINGNMEHLHQYCKNPTLQAARKDWNDMLNQTCTDYIAELATQLTPEKANQQARI